MDVEIELDSDRVMMAAMLVFEPQLIQQIKDNQFQDPDLVRIRDRIANGPDFRLEDEILYFRDRLCVPNVGHFKNQIMIEVHHTRYSMHPSSTKMYQNLRGRFWWNNMKREVAGFVARCLTCQKVKAKHRKHPRLLKPLKRPKWK